MTKLLVQNKKILKSNSDKYLVYNFGIPAIKTCPLAGECKTGCFATQQTYTWPVVKAAYEYRYQLSLTEEFIPRLSKELEAAVRKAKREAKQLVIRVHDSGDYYNYTYLEKWLTIFNKYPDVKFYSYTKSVAMFNLVKRKGKLPSNMRVVYSEGGLLDTLIKDTDYHARVFPDLDSLIAAGYADGTENDLVAGLGESNKIGLVYHGSKAKAWSTAS